MKFGQLWLNLAKLNMANIALSMLVLTSLTGSVLCAAEDTLLVTNVLYRHGDRAAGASLPISRYNESFWPYGYGEMTDLGITQQYVLGRFFRERYAQLLEDKFDYKKLKVRSSDTERCLVSAYSTLAGLYSNSTEDEDLELPFIRWQPIPVHSVPKAMDEILAMSKPCNLINNETVRVFNSSVVRKLNDDYTGFFKMLEKETGVKSISNIGSIQQIQDVLLCESIHLGRLPEWTFSKNVSCNGNTDIPCKDKTVWKILVAMQDYQLYVKYNSTTLHKFRGGPFLEEVVRKFEDYQGDNKSFTFNMYSAHATTMAAVLSAFGVFDRKVPQYASSVMIELHKSKDTSHYYEVKVFYKPITDNDTLLPMALPGCPAPCRLEDFSKLVDKYKISDWNAECGNNVPAPTVKPTASSDITSEPVNSLSRTSSEIIIIAICSSMMFIMKMV